MSDPHAWPAPAPTDRRDAPPGWQPPAPADARRRGLAVTAFVTGIATVLVGVVLGLAVPFVNASGLDLDAMSAIQTTDGVLTVVLSLVAVITGSVALARKEGAALAAAGTALGAAGLLTVAAGLLHGALYQVL
ncbi:hypothetical protein [Cellulosimicrobium cellulans]|uniref:hypothetical protein n=1 Tax=Cellulosimicrobium cellulans TaxID=1710 RepID=UPI00084890A9|nr:hypothetical protein [Cellulosimicrobium cellulans]